MSNTNSYNIHLPNLPFILYPKGYSSLVDKYVFDGLDSPESIKSNVAKVIISGTSVDNILPKFYYIPSLEKMSVVHYYLNGEHQKTDIYDIKNNPSKFIWDYLKNTSYFNTIVSLLSRVNFKFSLDDVTKSTKFTDIYKKIPYSVFNLIKIYDYEWSNVENLCAKIGKDAYKHVISKIPKNLQEASCIANRVNRIQDIRVYVYSVGFGNNSRMFFIGVPIDLGEFYPVVVNMYSPTDYKVSTLNNIVSDEVLEESLVELGYKSNIEFLKNTLKISESSISNLR